MANQNIPVLRATDNAILAFFEILKTKYKFQEYQVSIIGAEGHINSVHPMIEVLRRQNKYSISGVVILRNQARISYARNADAARFSTPDRINIQNDNSANAIGFEEAIAINELIVDSFLMGSRSVPTLENEPNAFAEVIASHQQIVTRLEQNLETIGERFSAERLKIQSEQDQFIRAKQAEYSELERRLREDFGKKEDVLKAREKDLDDRDNMHARRGLRAELKKRLQEHATKFTLTEKTRQLRWPLHVTVWVSLGLLGAGIAYSWILMGRSPTPDYVLLAKSAFLTVAALGILTWYIRWMNRWFEQHSDAEFNLKQFELDVDRASWVVETAMEWHASQHGVIPTSLLESISRNLFFRQDRVRDEEMHPADYLASALLGNASRARIKFGDAELDYSRNALKKAAKAVDEPNAK